MRSLLFDRAFFRLLLIAAPFSCGGRTFYEPPPAPTCSGQTRVIAYDWTSSNTDGGVAQTGDGGASQPKPFSAAFCANVCGTTLNCEAALADAGAMGVRCIEHCSYAVGCGRRPAGFVPARRPGDDALRGYLEQAAQLEAASVHAFRRLACELAAHDAPADLIAAAEQACAEEARHADRMDAIAIARGGKPQPVPAPSDHIRALEDLVRENVVEGCVREAYGAFVAWRQAMTAQDADLRAAMAPIAVEETGHARLAFAIDAWAQGVLPPDAWQRTRRARSDAMDALRTELLSAPSPSLQTLAGIPSAAEAAAWLAAATQQLWI